MLRPEAIAIVGGGAAGVLSALHLQRAAPEPVRVVVIEPRAELGRGVAYGTTDLGHLLNVRAARLSALPDEPDHFSTWARQRTNADSQSYLPRAWYGEYLASLLDAVEHVRARVVDLNPVGARVQIELSDGARRTVDRVVLAPGSSPPLWPDPLGGTDARWIRDPWDESARSTLSPEVPVLLVGTGLTSVDVALSLHAAGHRQIFATSRHGLFPHAHPDVPFVPLSIDPPRAPTARTLVAWARSIAAEVGDWRPVVDALRDSSDEIWGAMTMSDRIRLLSHIQRRWEVLRHRMAPLLAARLGAMRMSGQLVAVPGGVRSARTTSRGIEVALGDRSLRVGAVINCTGPTADVRGTRDPLVRRLLDRRYVHPGPLALGLETDAWGRVRGAGDALWLVGALRRGRQWETTAIPEIRAQAADLPRSMWRLDSLVGA